MNISFVYRKFRKSIAGFSLLAMLATFTSFAGLASASFSDTEGHWAEDYITTLVDQGVVSGYDDDTFGPDDSLTRAQLAKIAVLAFDIELDEEYDAGFADVDTDMWYSSYVNTAAKNGVVGGYTDSDGVETGYFGPDDTVNRAQAAKILVNAAGLTTNTDGGPHFDDVEEGTWYYDYVETAYMNSVLDGYGDGTYGPADSVTRGQISKMTVNAQTPVEREDEDTEEDEEEDTEEDEEEDTEEEDEEEDDDGIDGTLTIEMLDAEGGTIPKGATAVPVLGLALTAEDSDVTLDSLVLSRNGVGSSSDISSLYFYNESDRVGSSHTVSSDSNTATFSSVSVEVEAGETVNVWFKADFSSSATAGNENYFSLASADIVSVTGGEVSADFPIDGETFTVAGASAGTVTIEKNSTVSNPTIGDAEAEVGDFKLTAASEDVVVEQIALILKGTVSSEALTNFQLTQNGDVLATADAVNNSELFTFVLDTPFELSKGDTRSFSVLAEVNSSADPDDTIRIYLDEKTDLVAVGQTYGYGAQVTDTSYDNSANDGTDANWSTIQGGQFTIAFNGPSVDNFAPNAKDVGLLDLTFTSGRDVEVRRLTFNLTATGDGLLNSGSTAGNYTDIKLIDADSGSTLMGPSEFSLTGSDSTQDISYTDTWYVDEGETINASLTVDIASTSSLNADTIVAKLNAISTTEGVKDSGTGEFLTDIVPATAITGYTHNIQTASLAIALASSPVSDTFVKGTSGVTLVGLVFTAGAASDITLTKIQPTLDFTQENSLYAWVSTGASGTSFYGKEIIGTLYLYDEDGNQLGTSEAVPNGGKPTFDGFELEVPAGESVTVYVEGDVNSTAPVFETTNTVGIDIEATSDVTAEDEDGNSVTLTTADPNGSTDTSATTVAMTVSSSGSIVVSSPSSQTNDQLLAAGSSDVLLGSFKVKATDEDFMVDRISLYATDSGAEDSFKSVKIKYPTDVDDPDTLDGSSSVTFSGTAATFSNLEFMVPKDDDNVVFEVYVSANTHNDDSGAADTGDSLQMTLYPYAASTSTNTFNSVGQGSGTTKDADDSGVLAAAVSTNEAYVFKAVPIVSVDDTSASIVYGNEAEVFRFSVEADSGDLALLALKFDVSSSGILTNTSGLGGVDEDFDSGGTKRTSGAYTAAGAGKWKMYDSTNTSVLVGSGEYLHDTTNGNKVYMDVRNNITTWQAGTSTSLEQISSGSTITYIVKANVIDDGTSNTNSVSVRIADDSGSNMNEIPDGTSTQQGVAPGFTFASGANLGTASFVWSDRPNNSSFGTGAAMWHNGYKVTTIPSSYVTST